jgi:Flp pilus assembly protein TadD
LLIAAAAQAVPPGSTTAAESLVQCERANGLSGEPRKQALARGMALAEQALAADDHDARAYYATVCNLGKQMEDAGLGIGQLVSLQRLRRSMDAAIALAPGDSDALVAKAALLLELPRLLGGDAAAAEELLRRALAAEPDNNTARCYLARALTQRGAADEARALSAHC